MSARGASAPADPPLVLLDEPFAVLDPVMRFMLQGEFRALLERLHGTSMFVTHDLREAMRVGPRTGAASVPGGT